MYERREDKKQGRPSSIITKMNIFLQGQNNVAASVVKLVFTFFSEKSEELGWGGGGDFNLTVNF